MLSLRLKTVASLITTKSIIDVGCDHGYLDIYLTKKGIKCLATDISCNALSYAINNFKKNNVEIDTICTDGLKNININKEDTIVISGMGTDTIIKILSISIDNDLVISSNNHLDKLRRYVISKGYYIDKEVFVIDNDKPYVIIKFKKGIVDYSEFDYIIGINNDKYYLEYMLNKYNKILDSIPSRYNDKRNNYQKIIDEINKRIVNV